MDNLSPSRAPTPNGPPASVLAATSRFWIRSPDVAIGLVCGDARDCRAWKTWKWNRAEGRCRETWLGDDRKLFSFVCDSSEGRARGLRSKPITLSAPDALVAAGVSGNSFDMNEKQARELMQAGYDQTIAWLEKWDSDGTESSS